MLIIYNKNMNKAKILEKFNNKQEKILVSNILDKAYRFEKVNKLFYTNFLNLNELSIATSILNELKIKYYTYCENKKVIFFIPEYITIDDDFFNNIINCIKITPNVKGKLKHKDYMGAIYSLGLKNEMIGDIFAYEDTAYVFCMNSVSDYIMNNLTKVANQEVDLKLVDLKDAKDLNVNLFSKDYIVASLRIDAILSVVYKLGRKEAKEKITKGELFINDKNIFYPNTTVKENDIVSLKKCGKLKIGQVSRKTKTGNVVLNIEIYK